MNEEWGEWYRDDEISTPLLKKIQLEHDVWLICVGCVRKIVHGLGLKHGHDYKTSINCLTIVP